MKVARTLAALPNIPPRLRPALFSAMNAEIGPETKIAFPFEMYADSFKIGSGSFINRHFYCEAGDIRIGNGVQIGPFVKFSSTTHELGGPGKRAGKAYSTTITVEDGVWIGAGALVLPGVTIARGCVIAAGAVVTKDTEPNGLYMGVPAARAKDLGD